MIPVCAIIWTLNGKRKEGAYVIILIDMDDTIEQLLKAWLKGVNERYGYSVRYEDITSWDVSAPYPGLTKEQVYAIPDEPGFWGTVEPIGAILTILVSSLLVPVMPYMLSFAAGAMIYVVVEELIPEMAEGEHSHIGVLLFATGFTVMMALDSALG